MAVQPIELDFGDFVLEATLYDTKIARQFAASLPYKVSLMQWGKELYGSIGQDLGQENPVETIPAGGIAYSTNGAYVCIFFGQTPAWAVEHIGAIEGDQWQRLIENQNCDSVVIRLKKQI